MLAGNSAILLIACLMWRNSSYFRRRSFGTMRRGAVASALDVCRRPVSDEEPTCGTPITRKATDHLIESLPDAAMHLRESESYADSVDDRWPCGTWL